MKNKLFVLIAVLMVIFTVKNVFGQIVTTDGTNYNITFRFNEANFSHAISQGGTVNISLGEGFYMLITSEYKATNCTTINGYLDCRANNPLDDDYNRWSIVIEFDDTYNYTQNTILRYDLRGYNYVVAGILYLQGSSGLQLDGSAKILFSHQGSTGSEPCQDVHLTYNDGAQINRSHTINTIVNELVGLGCTNYPLYKNGTVNQFYFRKIDGHESSATEWVRFYGIGIEGLTLASPPPPTSGTQVFINETFTTGPFNLPEATCRDIDFISFPGTQTNVSLDNDWFCYVQNKTASDVAYIDWSNTSDINTVSGLKTNHTAISSPQYDAFVTTELNDMDLDPDDWIEFYCSVEDVTNDAYNYLVFTEATFTWFPIAISLKNGGCLYNSTVIGGNLDACVELYDVAGNDCNSTTKQYFKYQMSDYVNACPPFVCGEINFQNIDYIYLWRNIFSDDDTFYFDDFAIYREGIIANDSLPYMISVTPIPDPQNVSEVVSWSISIGDAEGPSSAIWSAFDCGDDGIFDFNWGKRGYAPYFDCSYSSAGNYTGTAYASDDIHYPSLNDSMTNIVEILALVGLPAPVQGGNCVGFSAPSCTGTCYFFDDFSYNNPVECNDWSGTAKDVNPASGLFSVFNLPLYKDEIELDGPNIDNGIIYETQYEDFTVEFKIRVNHHKLVTFSILDNELDQHSVFMKFDNYNAIVFDPGATTIKSMTPNQWYKFTAEINLENDDINWYVDNVLEHSGDFFDGATDTQRKFSFNWDSPLAEFDVDYITITYGTLQQNATVPEEEQPAYVYDGSLFCAINWTADSDRFSEQNCEDRGFSTAYPLLSLCVPRACVQDIGLGIVAWATRNIFTTIIIVTAFILIIPLLIALAKRKL